MRDLLWRILLGHVLCKCASGIVFCATILFLDNPLLLSLTFNRLEFTLRYYAKY